MLKALRCTHLAFKLGSNLVKKLIEPVAPICRGNRPYPAMTSVQRHGLSSGEKGLLRANNGDDGLTLCGGQREDETDVLRQSQDVL